MIDARDDDTGIVVDGMFYGPHNVRIRRHRRDSMNNIGLAPVMFVSYTASRVATDRGVLTLRYVRRTDARPRAGEKLTLSDSMRGGGGVGDGPILATFYVLRVLPIPRRIVVRGQDDLDRNWMFTFPERFLVAADG